MYFSKDDPRAQTRDAQELLRSLSYLTDDPSLRVAADGYYDEGTAAAVRSFQKTYGLPVTGEVDLDTYRLLREVNEEYRKVNAPPNMIRPFPDPKRTVGRGENSDLVLVIQLLLLALRIQYEFPQRIPLSGRYDPATAAAVAYFQKVNGLDATGIVDIVTWNRLAEEYNWAVLDNQ